MLSAGRTVRELKLSIGQHSDKGRKESNQDFHGALIPDQPALGLKGIAIALADGISSSQVSRIASESAVKGFLMDYYCTSDSWSVKTAAQRVIAATNSWLHAQTRRGAHAHDKDKGYVCTFSALVMKSTAAHIFHIGDSRIYRLVGQSLEQLTNDHRLTISSEQSYLSRALGMDSQIEIDYQQLPLKAGDVFILATDGVYEHVDARFYANAIEDYPNDLDAVAQKIVAEAYTQGSPDNLTIQIVRVDTLPDGAASEAFEQVAALPLPPLLDARMLFDGYRIIRQIHASSRSHIYLAIDTRDDTRVSLKIPSIDLRGDEAYLKRFMLEEWVARRLNSAHVLKPGPQDRQHNYLYIVTEFVDGQTLTQWMIDHPKPDLETVRDIVEQIARGLRAFHRMEMLHQDLRPENIMIDKTGTVKIIDFGSTKVTGVMEATPDADHDQILGTAQYTAPEYFLGDSGSARSDLYSLGVITYQMLTGTLPYGAQMARARSKSQQRKIICAPVRDKNRDVPVWMDAAIRQAVHPDPFKRQEALSEFLHDLRHPNESFLNTTATPLMERNPLLVWKGISFVLACITLVLLASQFGTVR